MWLSKDLSITARAWIVLGVLATALFASALGKTRSTQELNEAYRVIAEERSPATRRWRARSGTSRWWPGT
jgi:hypothetical protein